MINYSINKSIRTSQNILEVRTNLTACMDDVIVAITSIVVNTTIALSVKFSISK